MKRRNTPTQMAVLSILSSTGKAMSQDAIEQKIGKVMDRATVYRILNRFYEDGIVHKIVAEDGKQYFAVCMICDENTLPDNHFHFRCTNCQTIECLQSMVHFAVPEGYLVKRLNCVLVGICKACAEAPS